MGEKGNPGLGFQGPKGQQGPPGPRGEPWDQGLTGPNSTEVLPGAKGDRGDKVSQSPSCGVDSVQRRQGELVTLMWG